MYYITYIYIYIYIYIHISVQECIRIQTATFWIPYGHPARNKHAGNRLNFIHNHIHCGLNIQGCSRSLLLIEFKKSQRVSKSFFSFYFDPLSQSNNYNCHYNSCIFTVYYSRIIQVLRISVVGTEKYFETCGIHKIGTNVTTDSVSACGTPTGTTSKSANSGMPQILRIRL